MGLFDFLKKAEYAKIDQLETELQNKNAKIERLSKYEGVVDTEELIAQKYADFDKERLVVQLKIEDAKNEITKLKTDYSKALAVYNNLKQQVDIFTESLEMAEYGVYEPHFDFNTSDKFKTEIVNVRDKQKSLITREVAIMGGDNISWNGSLSQGQAMVKREKKLIMRAFNGECDSFIATVEWNNVQRMVERIHKSYDAINKVYEKQGININPKYKELKLDELHLTYEYQKKKYEEKEEQREIRERMREEEKVLREIEAAKIKAEKEEIAYQKALDKARKEIASAVGEKQIELLRQISELEARLNETEQNKERALSMAQQTRRGHVYVISNIGSFGENVYKIGMTRRLDPTDRVKELGDASVPFAFDVHALIFSEDAPALENALHKVLDEKRVNLVNLKREFFNVTLAEIEKVVTDNHGSIEFTKLAEAEQYRETLALRQKKSDIVTSKQNDYPENLFS